MNYYIFDDEKTQNFYPITLTRSTSDLRAGILKLRQKIIAYANIQDIRLIIDKNLCKIYQERHSDWMINKIENGESIFINSRIKNYEKLSEILETLSPESVIKCGDEIVLIRKNCTERSLNLSDISSIAENLTEVQTDKISLWNHIWELIESNKDNIQHDFDEFFYEKDNFFETELGVTILNPYNVWIGEDVTLNPGVVVDASNGAVVIDSGVIVMHNAVLIGPLYIGKKSKIKVGAKIYEGTSIGAVCKIGGEVEESIIQSYSNKQHDGFLGHCYLGEWVNLGADTNNSDLKNNYKAVKVYSYPDNKKIDSGTQFMGAIIGDHSKTGINSTINTGTVIGVACNLYGKDIISDFVSSFSWGEYSHLIKYKFEKFIETADLVKQRRGLEFSIAEKELYSMLSVKELT